MDFQACFLGVEKHKRSILEYEETVDISIEHSDFEYNSVLELWQCDKQIDTLAGTLSRANGIRSLRYSVQDIAENIIKEGEIEISKKWSIADLGMVIGFNEITVTAISKQGKEYMESITVFNMSDENCNGINIDEADNDDGISNYYEGLIGTDKNKADTDSDGLSDAYEVYLLGTDPLKYDTDSDGISDGAEDEDNDGIAT